jgi:hypothetical protein
MNSTTLLGTSSSSTTSSSNTTVQEDDGEIVYVTVTTVITIPNPATTMAVQQNTTSITVTSSSVQLTVQAQSLLSESPIKTITIDAPSSLALVGVQNCSTTTNLADEQFDSSTSLLSLTDAFTTSVTSSDGYGNTPARATSV